MNRRRLICFLVLLMAFEATPSWGEPVEIFRAAVVIKNEKMQATVMEKLGCDPCSDVVAGGSGGIEVHYVVSRYRALVLRRADIKGASIQEVKAPDQIETSFQLMIRVSESARKQLSESYHLPADYGANYCGGKLVGVGPLVPFGSYYIVGSFQSKDEATEAADIMGLDTAFVPYDEERSHRVRDRLLK